MVWTIRKSKLALAVMLALGIALAAIWANPGRPENAVPAPRAERQVQKPVTIGVDTAKAMDPLTHASPPEAEAQPAAGENRFESTFTEQEPNGCITLVGGGESYQTLRSGDDMNGTVDTTDTSSPCLYLDDGTGNKDYFEDLYGFTVSQSGTYNLSLNFSASDLDLYILDTDLYILNPDCDGFTCGVTCDMPETFAITLDPGTYILCVNLYTFDGACEPPEYTPYVLSVSGGGSCTYGISPTSKSFQASGGQGSVTVTAGTGCAWETRDYPTWVTINSGLSGSGNGSVSYTVAANSGPARDATLAIAGKPFSISQQGQGGGTCKTYTTDADFDLGTVTGLEHNTVHNQLQLSSEATTLPFIWVPNSNQGTISKVDTVTGKELGRYRTCPADVYGDPSRTTVDLEGCCYVANRQAGSVVKVGLLEAGKWVDRNGNSVCDTSRDTNGDGDITDAELLAWGQDECVLYEVVLITGKVGTYTPGQYTGGYSANYPRAVAVDATNNVWAGVYNDKKYYHIKGDTGQVLKTVDVSSTGTQPYGAVIDSNGILWSAAYPDYWVLRIDPVTNALTKVDLTHLSYGLGIDKNNHLFVSGYYGQLARINTSTAALEWDKAAAYGSKGVAVTPADGDVWVADTDSGEVQRFSNNGDPKATITGIGSGTLGVAVDAAGKVWAVNNGDEYIKRINPATNQVDLSKRLIGTTHYGYSDMTGMVSRTVTQPLGTWRVVYDSGAAGTAWGKVSWNGSTPGQSSIAVEVSTSENGQSWSTSVAVTNGQCFTAPNGRYLQIVTTLKQDTGGNKPVLYDLTACSGCSSSCQLSCTATVPASGSTNSSISFAASATATGCTGTTTYSWSFGDGATSSQQNPSHAYSAAGTYSWTMTATNGSTTCDKSGSISISGGGGTCKTYTTDADFDLGAVTGLEHNTVHNQLQLSSEATTLPFIWVPNSNQGTISKVDTVTGKELGRYRTCPTDVYGDPSRTTVDLEGCCYVANRQAGSVIKVGLLEAGKWIDRNSNGVCDTSRDTNGDGDITDAELLAWGQDECVLYEVVLITGKVGTYTPGQYTGGYSANYPRAVAVDATNNVWAGVWSDKKYYHIKGDTGQVLKTVDVSSTGTQPYGAVIDSNGILWSAAYPDYWVLRIDPSTNALAKVALTHLSYGLGIDKNNHLFVSGYYGQLARINTSTATLEWDKTAAYGSKGVAVTPADGDVWVADTDSGEVQRFSNNGDPKATITGIGSGTLGVAVDAAGKIWAVNNGDEYIKRINPATNQVDLSKRLLGTTHYGYSDMTGMVSRTVTQPLGTWRVVYDSGAAGTAWGKVSWNGSTPGQSSITVEVSTSENGQSWSTSVTVTNGQCFTVPNGRYLQIVTTLKQDTGGNKPVLYDLTACSGCSSSCQLSCTATVPASGSTNSSISFAASATATGCSGTTTYSWTFGDGSSSTQQNPSHSYSAAGTYSWTMTATNGSTTCTKSGSISISGGGTCSLTCSASAPASGATNSSISFTASATATGCSGTTTYYWNFGDGSSSTLQNPSHSYSAAGTYSWTMTATNGSTTCTKSGSISISGGGNCTLACAATVAASGRVNSAVSFSATATATGCSGATTYYWTFGDGGTSSQQNPSHTYSAAGSYGWTMTATNGSATCSKNGTIAIYSGGREVRVAGGNCANPGGTLTVPIELIAQGDENALGFSVTFDRNILTYASLAKGADASNATIVENTSQVSNGKLGVQIGLAMNVTFPAGTRQVLLVNFSVAAGTAATSTSVCFGDSPVVKEISDIYANPLPATWTCGSFCFNTGYEADVAPRPTGNGSVSTTDWVQLGRFAANLDTAAAGPEFQKGDCAPRANLGNGQITTTDWVQAGRYAAQLDPLTPAGGPTQPTERKTSKPYQGERKVTIENAIISRGQSGTVKVTIESLGNENALGFSISFDPALLAYGQAAAGSGASNAQVIENSAHASSGKVGILLALPAGQTFGAGKREAVVLTFTGAAGSGAATTPISFGDMPIQREISDAMANVLQAAYIDGTVTIQAGGGKPGDCNGDGQVSIGEVQKAINMFLGLQAPDCNADCNGDSQVSIGEVQKVINVFLMIASGC